MRGETPRAADGSGAVCAMSPGAINSTVCATHGRRPVWDCIRDLTKQRAALDDAHMAALRRGDRLLMETDKQRRTIDALVAALRGYIADHDAPYACPRDCHDEPQRCDCDRCEQARAALALAERADG